MLPDNVVWILINSMLTQLKHDHKYTKSEAHCDSVQNAQC